MQERTLARSCGRLQWWWMPTNGRHPRGNIIQASLPYTLKPVSHRPSMLPMLVSMKVSTMRVTRLRYQPFTVCASSRSCMKSL